MARGGIQDHIEGGFFRYSVDAEWRLPHFEKMLYDNALLISTYSKAYQTFSHPLYKEVVSNTISWVLSNMKDSEVDITLQFIQTPRMVKENTIL